MSKTAIPGAKRTNLFLVEPEKLTLVWDETDPRHAKFNFDEIMEEHDCLDPTHLLYDAKIYLPVTDIQIKNVTALGVLQSVSCRKNGEAVEVVAGRQRVKWARYANILLRKAGEPEIRIPVKMQRGSEGKMLATLISENEMRCADDMLNLARKASDLVDRGYEVDEIANWFNCGAQTIRNRLSLLDLAPKVQKAIKQQQITVTEALKLKKEPHEKQEELLKVHVTATGRREKRAAKSVGEDKKKPRRIKAPSKAVIRALIEQLPQSKTRSALEWAVGDLSHRKAKEVIKEL